MSLAPKSATSRVRMTVAYDGTDFAGFQAQEGGVRTVQVRIARGMQQRYEMRNACSMSSMTHF